MKTRMNMTQRVETAAIAGLVLLACGGATWAEPSGSDDLSRRQRKTKQVLQIRPAEVDRPIGLQQKPGAQLLQNGQTVRTRRLSLGLPVRHRTKPGSKPIQTARQIRERRMNLGLRVLPVGKPDYTKPGNACSTSFGFKQILAMFKGGDPENCSPR